MRKKQKTLGVILGVILLAGLLLAAWLLSQNKQTAIWQDESDKTAESSEQSYRVEENASAPAEILSFNDCVRAGFAVTEGYPRQCKTTDGKTFTEEVDTAPAPKENNIKVETPNVGQKVSSPLEIVGQARGGWYSEGGFPVYLYDANRKLLGRGIASAQGEWMTEAFVPFKLTLKFDQSSTATGTLVLRKDNPANLPEHDDVVEVSVKF